MEIVPFDPSDLAALDPPAVAAVDWQAFADGYGDFGPSFTLMDGDKVLACGGLIVSGRVGLAWAALSDAIRARPVVLYRTVKRKLNQLVMLWGLEQVVSTANDDLEAGRRWMEGLGFHEEGMLTDYMGTGETHVRYVLDVR